MSNRERRTIWNVKENTFRCFKLLDFALVYKAELIVIRETVSFARMYKHNTTTILTDSSSCVNKTNNIVFIKIGKKIYFDICEDI